MTRDSLLAVERRLTDASEGSRELDALVAIASGDAVCGNPKNPTFVRYRDEDTGEPNELYSRAAPVTSSIDAALSLVSRCLPDACVNIVRWTNGRGLARLTQDEDERMPEYTRAATPALALSLALCRALLAKETE